MHGYHSFVLGDGMSYLEPPNSPPRPAHPLLMVLYFHVFYDLLPTTHPFNASVSKLYTTTNTVHMRS